MEDRSKKAISLFNKHAVGYASKYAHLQKYHDGFNFLSSLLPVEARVLDMACGPGNITNYLLTKRPDLAILGIDLAPKMIEIASKNNPKAEFKLKDIREITDLNDNYSGVFLGFGTPYLTKDEVGQVILDVYEVLTESGLLYISTMEGKYAASDYQKSSDGEDEMFIYYHEQEQIRHYLRKAGFTIIWEKDQAYFEDEDVKYSDYIVIAKKNT